MEAVVDKDVATKDVGKEQNEFIRKMKNLQSLKKRILTQFKDELIEYRVDNGTITIKLQDPSSPRAFGALINPDERKAGYINQ